MSAVQEPSHEVKDGFLMSNLETNAYRDDTDDDGDSSGDGDDKYKEHDNLMPHSSEDTLNTSSLSLSLSLIQMKLNALIAGLVFVALLISLTFLIPRSPSTAPTIPSAGSSQESHQQQQEQHWLMGVWSAWDYAERRDIIRATWQELYTDSHPNIKTVFVLAAPPTHVWDTVLKLENDTYGDLVILHDLEESYWNGNHVKNMYWFRHLRDTYGIDTPWNFVSKVDDDSFVSALEYYDRFIVPNLGHERLVIGRMLGGHVGFPYPGGQMYTFSYDLMLQLLEVFEHKGETDQKDEDLLTGWLIQEGKLQVDWLNLNNRLAFDVNHDNDDPWEWSHQVLRGAINPHKLKKDEDYLKVAALYNADGLDIAKVRELYGHVDNDKPWHESSGPWHWWQDESDWHLAGQPWDARPGYQEQKDESSESG